MDTSADGAVQRFTDYEEHFGFVWSSLRRLGVAASDLEDATHDVFVVAHRRRAEVARAASARGWLWGAVRRVASNYRRGAFRHRRRVAALGAIGASAVVPDRDLERADATLLVTRFLDGLAEPQRDVFVLIELQQMTAREVADVLRINPNTAAARLRAARKAFQHFAARVREENPFNAADALARTRAADAPSREAKARVGSALAATLLPSASPAMTGLGAAGMAAWVKAGAVSIALAGATLGVIGLVASGPRLADPRAAAPTTPESAPRSVASVPPRDPRERVAPAVPATPPIPRLAHHDPAHEERPERAGSRSARRTGARTTSSPPVTETSADLSTHNEWLERARRAFARGDHARAAGLCAEYRRAHESGPFVAEMHLLEIRARCASGDVTQARALARSLSADHPGSPHLALAERTCAGELTKSNASGD